MDRRGFSVRAAGVLAGLLAGAGMGGCERKAAAGRGPRIAVLSPALAATLKDLGVEGSVVGRHAWDLVLDPAVPVVGTELGDVDYERLMAAGPTLVVGQFGAGGVPARLAELAASRGWKVRDYNPLSLADVLVTAGALAAEVESAGCEGVAARLEEVRRSLRASLAGRAERARAGRVLLLAEVSPLAALGPGSVHQDVLTALGGVGALREGGAYVSLDGEDLRRIAPDAIMVIAPRGRGEGASAETAAGLIARFGRAGTLDIPAFRAGRVVLIDDPLTQLPATTIRSTAEAMGAALDAWAGLELGVGAGAAAR